MNTIIISILITTNIVLVATIVIRKAYNRGYVRGGSEMARNIQDAMIAADDPRFTVKVRQLDPNSSKNKDYPKYPFDYKTEEEFHKIVEQNYPPNDIDPFN